ncbi:hypothetical protein Hypma_014870 [Hypsizygus marmoreus]|uniref:Uncharacterized protein n=1 Tax=Hypsizygus marmoreus TaxID=39966 RepID=A0A369K3R8_HYPMA|nr:hypothetical protein Hypma_014870 [Hypsizygus marmoreus]
MEVLYRDSNGEFLRPTFEDTSDKNFSWGHLSRTSQALALAARALKDVPVEQYSKETGPSGEYLELEWSREIDWFRPGMPWRGYIPGLSADNPYGWFNEFTATAWGLAWLDRDDQHGYVFNNAWRDACLNDLNSIAHCCATIREHGIYPSGNPIPTPFADNITGTMYPSLHAAEEQATTLKRHMLDSIAFVWWFKEMFENWTTGLPADVVDRVNTWTAGLTVKRGFLVDLTRDWESVDIARLVACDVPVIYAWTPAEANNPRFQRLSPAFAMAYWGYVDSIPGGREGYFGVPDLRDRFPDVMNYDSFLQNGMAGFVDDGFRPGPEWDSRRVFVCDFQGWRRREITDLNVKRALRTRYYARMLWIETDRVILYWRFRPRPTTQGSTLMDEDADEERVHEIRALHQFKYAPHSGRSYDKERGEIEYPRPVSTPLHPHVARHTIQENLNTRRRWPAHPSSPSSRSGSREARRMAPYPRSPEQRQAGGNNARLDNEVLPGERPSLASRLSDAVTSPPPPSLAQRLSSPGANPTDDTLLTDAHSVSSTGSALFQDAEPDWRMVALAEWTSSARTWSKPMFPSFPTVTTGEACVWNPVIFEYGVLQVRSCETDVRLRLHAVLQGPDATLEDILSWAIHRGLRFAIGYPDAELQRFLPAIVTEADYAVGNLYNGIEHDPDLEWTRGATDFIARWRAAATKVLLRPHARAAVFLGGPISWISRLFRGDELIADAMMGPSVQVTVHRKGDLDARHPDTLWYDQLSSSECNILYGFIPGDKNKPETDKTLWPTEAQLWECLSAYSGTWSDVCETIYASIWSKIEQGLAEPRTKGGWNQFLRNSRYTEPAGLRPRSADWEHADKEIDTHFPLAREWNGKRLTDITLPLEYQM